MLDAGSIPAGGTIFKSRLVFYRLDFFIFPMKTRFYCSVASAVVCHIPAQRGGTFGGIFSENGGTSSKGAPWAGWFSELPQRVPVGAFTGQGVILWGKPAEMPPDQGAFAEILGAFLPVLQRFHLSNPQGVVSLFHKNQVKRSVSMMCSLDF